MRIIKKETTATWRIKGSEFIGFLHPVSSVNAFEEKLASIKSTYHDATHHCYAYRIDPSALREFTQDDREPGGTAGVPILNRLRSGGIVNAALIVVRYYGGTNLGKAGLKEAYGTTAGLCIEKNILRDIVRSVNIEVKFPYHQQNRIDRLKTVFNLVELDAGYLEEVRLVFACPEDRSDSFLNELEGLGHLDIRHKKLNEGFIEK